jgi:hypothetical protein
MNKIKFRLRDENKKIIGYEYFTQGEDLSGHWHYDFSMQGIKEWFHNFKWITKIRYRDLFSGLKDRDNMDIYENDVIENDKNEREVIIFANGEFTGRIYAMKPIFSYWKIIGDIYSEHFKEI